MRADTARGIFIVIQNEKLPESFNNIIIEVKSRHGNNFDNLMWSVSYTTFTTDLLAQLGILDVTPQGFNILSLSWGEDNVFLNEVVNYPDNLGVEEILRSIYNSSIEGQLSLEIERDLLESEIEELRNLGYHIILKDKYTDRNLIQWSIRPSLS